MAQSGERLGRDTLLALFAMSLGVLVIANDFTAFSVALPSMEQDLDTDLTTAQWVINAYALTFGVLIITGGRLADLFGRRRIFFIGAGIFAAFSLLAGVGQDIEWVVACRALMGVGGAMVWPAVLGMMFATLPEEKAGLAGGLVLGVAGFGNAIGPLLGGFLSDSFSWRWIFFLNLPIAAFAVLMTWRAIPADEPSAQEGGIDYRGIFCLSFGILAVLVALDEGPSRGWTDPLILGLFAGAIALLVAFAVVELGAGSSALVPRDVMSNANFAAACLTVLLMSAIFFAVLLYVPQFMERVLDFSPVESGAGLLPLMITFAATSFISGPIYPRFGPKVMVTFGAVGLTVGIFLLSFLDADSSYGSLVAPLIVLGVGVGVFYSSITTAAVTALDPSRASLAGGIVYMFQIAGGSIGLGLNTAIVTSADTLPEGIETAFKVDAALGLVGVIVSLAVVGGAVHLERVRGMRALHGHQRAHL